MIHERALADQVEPPHSADPVAQATRRELAGVVDQELLRLPEHYRLPLILCHLEGQTHEAAAAALNCPLGTLNSRLARGRRLLKNRLLRRGVTLDALTALPLPSSRATAALVAVLRAPTSAVLDLAGETLRGLAFAAGLKIAAALVPAVVLVAGLVFATLPALSGSEAPPVLSQRSAENPPPLLDDPDAGSVPAEAIARIGSTRFRQWGDVTGLAYSPDGKWLASISTSPADPTARLWDAATGKEKLRMPIKLSVAGRPADSRALGFSADGKQFLVVDPTSVRGTDIATGKPRFVYDILPADEANNGLIGVGLSPDGRMLVLAWASGRVEVRDAATGIVQGTGEHALMRCSYVPIEFSHNGKRFALLGADGEQGVIVYDTRTCTHVALVRAAGKSIRQVCFMPNPDTLAMLFYSGKSIFERAVGFFDLKTSRLGRIVKVDGATYCFAVSPDGELLLAGNGHKKFSQLIDTASGREIGRVPSSASVLALAFSPDGRLAAGAKSYSGAISIWDIASRHYHPLAAEPVTFLSARFSTDGHALHSVMGAFPVIDWRSRTVVGPSVEPNPEDFRYPRCSPDGKLLAVPAGNGPIWLVDASTGQPVRKLADASASAGGPSMVFSADGRRFAANQLNKVFRVWDVASGRKLAEFKAPELSDWDPPSLSADGRILAVSCNQGVTNGNILYTWDVAQQKQLARIEAPTFFFLDAVLSPNGRFLAGGGGDERRPHLQRNMSAVTIWDAHTGKEVFSLPGHRHETAQPGAACEFSPDNRLLVTGDSTGQLRLWEVATGQEMHRFKGHRSFVAAHFSPDGRILVAASEDAPCFLWDVTGTAHADQPVVALDGERVWSQLAAADARQAFGAIRRLVANPGPAVTFLQHKLKPAVALDNALVNQLLRDLDADGFREREQASAELLKWANRLAPRLQAARQSSSPEARRRLDQVLEKARAPSPERLRESRALMALEWIATPAAVRLLDELACGARDDALTIGAAASRARLPTRTISPASRSIKP